MEDLCLIAVENNSMMDQFHQISWKDQLQLKNRLKRAKQELKSKERVKWEEPVLKKRKMKVNFKINKMIKTKMRNSSQKIDNQAFITLSKLKRKKSHNLNNKLKRRTKIMNKKIR